VDLSELSAVVHYCEVSFVVCEGACNKQYLQNLTSRV
jgi:hypothetical protein